MSDRLGWTPAYRRECWVRVTDAPGGFDIDFSPFSAPIPNDRTADGYRCLRGGRQSIDELLDMSNKLRAISHIKQRTKVYVGEHEP